MANKKSNLFDKSKLTKRQASVINRGNRSLSGNINSLIDNLNTMTYGIQRTDKIDSLVSDFDNLLKGELHSITRATDGDTTSFIAKLFSENNKRNASAIKSLENMFDMNEAQLSEFFGEKYRNRLVKYADLHEVASQLVELQEAITITRDAIISSDIVDGRMTRNLKIDTSDEDEDDADYIPIIEKVEKKFGLQKKIKNFIVPKTLEYGEYLVYCIPYSKVFEDFAKEQRSENGRYAYRAYNESTDFTLYQYLTKDATKKKEISKNVLEYVKESSSWNDLTFEDKNKINTSVPEEFDKYLKNITINNDPIPLPILEEGVESQRHYYQEFVEKTIAESAPEKEFSFNRVMKNIDTGVHSVSSSKPRKTKDDDFSDIKDCYIKLIDPNHLIPIEIMSETIGYYYIQEEDVTTTTGMLTSAVYYNNTNTSNAENDILNTIAETIVASFDKKFLQENVKFKKLIVEALNYYKLSNQKIKFQFIPKEYVIRFTVNEDENGNGRSIIEQSLFYAKLYLMLLLFKMMSIILYSNDTKVNYIKQSGIEKDVTNKIQEIARRKQQRQVTITDMFSYTTLINKIGNGSEMYIPVGKTGERGIETEILSGQDVQLNTELMEMLKKAYISGTGVPDVLINYLHEAEFAKTIELANNRFHGNICSYQLDFNDPITELYKRILRYSTTIPDSVIDDFEWSFSPPKYGNSNVTNDLINNHNALQDFLIQLYFGQDFDSPENTEKVKQFKKLLAEDRLSVLNFKNLDDIYKKATLEGTSESLNPDNEEDNDDV